MYLICDNGYLCWPSTICPYMRSESRGTRLEDLFSTNIESVRKDVECVFGILKSRWGCLDRGFKHRKIKVLGNIFGMCSCFKKNRSFLNLFVISLCQVYLNFSWQNEMVIHGSRHAGILGLGRNRHLLS